MSSRSGAPVSPSHLLPTQKNLSELLEKLLTVFSVKTILDGGELPTQRLQREARSEDRSRSSTMLPMVGNDFDVQAGYSIAFSWKALLQLEQDDGSDKICLPFCDAALHPTLDEATATKLAEQAAKLLRSAWPEADFVDISKRRQLGLPFVDPGSPDNQLFRWLASKDLNPVSEGVFLTDLHESWGLLCQLLRQRGRSLSRLTLAPFRKFTGPDNWVISLPVIATILLLMTHPRKETKPLADNPDRDLSWTLDSLHGFCRKDALDDGSRHPSWSLGTFPDRWVYLNFIFSYFTPDTDVKEWIGSGMRCDRRTITVPLDGPGGKEIFKEQRLWVSVRTATAYQDSRQPDHARMKGPATVGLVLSDPYHYPISMRRKAWEQTGLQPARGASGVTAFQMLLWGGVDMWSESWGLCLDYIDRLHQVQVEDIDGSRPEKLCDLMFDPQGWLAKEYFVTAHLLKNFRRHIDVSPRSLQQMRRTWEMAYPSLESDLTQRFDGPTQLTLLENWTRLLNHAKAQQGKLVDRIEKMSADLLSRRDSVSITGPHSRHAVERRDIMAKDVANHLAADDCERQRCLREQSLGGDMITKVWPGCSFDQGKRSLSSCFFLFFSFLSPRTISVRSPGA
ncbi:hypothetical protein C8A05DRAFT_19751 [Staphylotrichum tortipilum]|uniref:Uncharacterized protein n=1 Tax=Staphylotrichum tortipilum TaxID=2831512 RepID=A0AAN6MB24_9PEZI|nr:hypothetical protein C8A05DRAFT_19751 [Staphylotrichum longicolle]